MFLLVLAMAFISVGQTANIAPTYAKEPHAVELELVWQFDPALSEFPKGIAFDRQGNVYLGMQFLREVRKLSPNGTETTIATLPFSGPPGTGFLPAFALVESEGGQGNIVFASLVDLSGSTPQGVVYRIEPNGAISLVPGSEAISFGNGMTTDHRGNVYVANSTTGAIWRIGHDSGLAELWIQDALLEGDGSLGFGVRLGVGALTVDGKSLLATVAEKSRVVRIEIERDGSAGAISTLVEDPSLYMTEGVAVDRRGTTFISSWFNSSLSTLDKHGNLTVVANSDDGLLGPVTLSFGSGRLSKYLYIVNQSGWIFADPKPALYRVRLTP